MKNFLIYGEEPYRVEALINQTLNEFSFDEEEKLVLDKFDGTAVDFLSSFPWLGEVKVLVYKPRELKEGDSQELIEYLKESGSNVLIIAPGKIDARQKKFLAFLKEKTEVLKADKYSPKQLDGFIRKMLPSLKEELIDTIINSCDYYEEGEVFYTFYNHLIKLKALAESGYELNAEVIQREFGAPAQKIFSASSMLMKGDVKGFVTELEKTPAGEVLPVLGALFYEVKKALSKKMYGAKESGVFNSVLERMDTTSLESLLNGITDGIADIKAGRKAAENVLEQVTGLFVLAARKND